MTVQTSAARVQYATNGTTGPWTVPFYFLQDGDLQVVYADSLGDETTLVLDVDYTAYNAGVLTGGSIITTDAFVAGGTLTIIRDVAYTQETEYSEGDPFPAKSHERALDKITMGVQQLAERLDRAVVFPVSENAIGELPPADERADRLLGFDSEGNFLPTLPSAGSATALALDLLSSATNKGASLVNFKLNAVGAVARSLHTRGLGDASLLDFGGDPTGVEEIGPHLQAMIDRAAGISSTLLNSPGIGIKFPFLQSDASDSYSGTYYLNSTVTVPFDVDGLGLYGEPGKGPRIIVGPLGKIIVGDNTDTCNRFVVQDMLWDAEDDTLAANVCFELRTASACRFEGVILNGFSIGIDAYRLTRSVICNSFFYSQTRTGNPAIASIRLNGTVDGRSAGNHIYHNEFLGNASDPTMVSAHLKVICADGLYLDHNHYTQYVNALLIEPTAANDSNFISDVRCTSEYYDNPAETGVHVVIGGTVGAGGVYQNMQWMGCMFRGAAGNAENALLIDVTDAGGFTDGLRNIKILGGTMRQLAGEAILARGSSVGRLEVYNLSVDGVTFEENNYGNLATASCATVQAESFEWVNNVVGADAFAATNLVTVNLSLADSGKPSFKYGANDYSKATNTGDVYNTTLVVGASVSGGGDIFPGPGLDEDQVYKVSTTNKNPTIIWKAPVSTDGQLGQVVINTKGCSRNGTAGAVRAIYENNAAFVREEGGTASVVWNTEVHAHSVIAGHTVPVTLTRLDGTAWVGSAAKVAGDRVTSGGNLYLAMTAGNLHATVPPSHTVGVLANGTVDLGFVSAVEENNIAMVVCGQASTDMDWSAWVRLGMVP